MRALQRGENPRDVLSCHRERGPKRYEYTVEDVARVTGYAVNTLRTSRIDSLIEVVHLALRRLRRHRKPVIPEEWTERQRRDWGNRWPRFELYECSVPGCKNRVLVSDLCEEHGNPAVRFSGDYGHFWVRFGPSESVPLHRLILQPAKGMHTHHIDFNKWNNRRENLKELTQEEHFKIDHRRIG